MKDLKYQKTVERIQAAVPEIMELKKGCKVYDRMNDKIGIYKGLGGGLVNCDILGRDITLEDCLIAINKNQESHYVICSDGEFGEPTPEGIYGFKIYWLLNTPFHEQSDETKEFIGNLLK